MGDPTDPTRSNATEDSSADPPPGRQGLRRRFPKPPRTPSDARPSHLDQWYSDRLFVNPYNWFAKIMLLMFGGVLLACGTGSVVTLVADAPGGWELVLRLLSTALVAVALTCWVLAFRRHPRPGYAKPALLAVAAVVAGVAAIAVATWITGH